MTIGKRIKERRLTLNISVDELAELLNKNRATIYRYEKGEIENLPIDVLEPLAKALATTPQYLMGWNDNIGRSSIDIATLLAKYFGTSIHEPLEERIINHFENWINAFPDIKFTDEEYDKIIEYGKFLISQRDK